jgi:hypothetical protein
MYFVQRAHGIVSLVTCPIHPTFFNHLKNLFAELYTCIMRMDKYFKSLYVDYIMKTEVTVISGAVKSRSLNWAGHVVPTQKTRTAYRMLVGKRRGKRLLGRSRRRWEFTFTTDLIDTDLWTNSRLCPVAGFDILGV